MRNEHEYRELQHQVEGKLEVVLMSALLRCVVLAHTLGVDLRAEDEVHEVGDEDHRDEQGHGQDHGIELLQSFIDDITSDANLKREHSTSI